MSGLSLRVAIAERRLGSDEEEAGRLVKMIADGVQRGARGALAVALRPARVEWFDLGGIVRDGVNVDAFLGALSRSPAGEHPAPLAVGLAGRFEVLRGGQRAPIAMVFLEWSDDRWWHWQRLLRAVEEDEEPSDLDRITRATDGDPVPDGLGRWYVRGRRARSSIRFGPVRLHPDGRALVH